MLLRRSRAASLIITAVGAATLLAFARSGSSAVEANSGANPNSEPFPITVEAKPSTSLVGSVIELSGSTLALLNNDVVVTIAAPKSTPPQSTKLPAARSADGTFKVSYVPKVAGAYTVDATAPDGRGHASASFTVENPRQMSPATTQALADLAQDADEIVSTSRQKLNNIPPSPARDEAEQKLDAVTQSMGEFVEVSKQLSANLGEMIRDTANLPPNSQPAGNAGNATVAGKYTLGGDGTVAGNASVAGKASVAGNTTLGGDGSVASNMQVTLSKVAADREALVEVLGQASQVHQRSQQEIQKLKMEQLTCDNLEVVAEGIKFVGVMFNFMTGLEGIAKNFVLDFAGAALSDQVKSRSGSAFGGFLAGEGVKNYDTLARDGEKNATKWKVDLGNVISSVNDVAGFVVDRVMDQYCEQFTGPVTAHMHAIFADRGLTWWEYSFDVRGQLTLHYPKGASGGSVPLKGRIEGFATNYKVRENALTVKFPDLMTSTVQKRFYIMPMAPTDTQTGMFKKISSVEGSVFGNLVTPSNFLFEVHGTATADQLNIEIGPASTDTDAKARVIVLYLPVLSLSLGYTIYSLPYKPVHFVFERTATTYPISLTAQNKVIRGKQHFENKKGNSDAMGDYTVDIEACNPDC
jgi:hypothetical protein